MIKKYISSADIGLVHTITKWKSHKLGFSNKFMLYSVAGIPIISTKQMACIEYGKKYNHAVFYDENSVKSLKNAIEYCLNHFDSLKNNAVNIYENEFWEKESKHFIDMYKSIS